MKYKPDDICVCWRDDRHYILTSWYKDLDKSMWDHIIIMPEKLVGTRCPFTVKFWEKVKAEVIK